MNNRMKEERGHMASSNRKPRPGRRRPGVVSAVVAAALGAIASVVAVSSAGASAATSGNSGNTGSGSSSAAVVTPLLKMFEFGNTIGLPLACSDAGSIVSIIGTQTGGAKVTSKLVTELDSQCSELSAKGGTYLQQAITQSRRAELAQPRGRPADRRSLDGTEHRRYRVRTLIVAVRSDRRRARGHRHLLRGFVTCCGRSRGHSPPR